MYRKSTVRLVLTCGTLALSVGCHKQATVQVPINLPAPQPEPPATIPEPTPPPATAPPPVAPPVAITPTLPAPPPTQKPSPFPAGPSRPAPVTPVPAPALGAILSADQRKKLDADYQADIKQANQILNSTRGKTLNPTQTDAVNRARAFIRQAAQYHDRDLATAAELARRARVLTQDLAGTH